MPSDAAIARMRATASAHLPDTATIQRRAETSDGGGGTTTMWSQLAVVACRVAPIAGGEANTRGGGTAGDRISDESTHVVTMPAETDIVESDRIVIGATTLEVTLVRTRGAWELSRRVEAKEAP